MVDGLVDNSQIVPHNCRRMIRQSSTEHFDVVTPERWTLPVVLNSPHSGSWLPKDLRQSTDLTVEDLRRSEDRFVDELFVSCVTLGAPLVRAHISRAYIDLNREPYELDATMFGEALPVYANASSPRVLSGLGTIPKIVGEGLLIYNRKLKVEEALDRINSIYNPYHQVLNKLMSEPLARTGYACLIDCHSMPPSERSGMFAGPDIVLGDRFGSACAREITECWRKGFESAGLKVRLNHPYPGGYITETYGQPRRGSNALQIEINRALYMSPTSFEKNRYFNVLATVIQSVFQQFARDLPDMSEPSQTLRAAE
jgi:N-formylglutamate deformylase